MPKLLHATVNELRDDYEINVIFKLLSLSIYRYILFTVTLLYISCICVYKFELSDYHYRFVHIYGCVCVISIVFCVPGSFIL